MYDDEELDYRPVRRFPKVPLDRRFWAFFVDFLCVWIISGLGGAALQWLIFLGAWFALRVGLVERNQGQSIGSWAFDIKVIDIRYRIPELVSLAKREGIVGFTAMLAMYGLQINVANGISMLILIAPLFAGCAVAIADEEFNQAFHDRIAETYVIQTQRGFSLDLRIKQIIAELRQNMQK
ncbi:MAG: RDD family protein [Limnothrix sp. RL_2_0]|nr:RDD family protein [Limnothrix sp. RL_2_0]